MSLRPRTTGGVDNRGASGAHTDDHVESQRGRTLPHDAVRLVVMRAQLSHVAEHGDAAGAAGQRQVRQRDERGFHRRGIRVVRIVQHRDALVCLQQLHPPSPRRGGRDLDRNLVERHREDPMCDRDGHRRVQGLVRAPQGDGEPMTVETERGPEPIVDADLANSVVGPGPDTDRHHRGERCVTETRRRRVVGVEHRGSRGGKRLDELGEHSYHALASAEVFGMREAGVRHDSGVGPRDVAQRFEVARESLAHLGDDDSSRRRGVAQRDREPELVVVRLRVGMTALRRERGREQILGRGLPGRPADRDHVQIRSVEAKRSGNLLQRAERVADVHERAPRSEPGPVESRRHLECVIDKRDMRARVERGRHEIVPVACPSERDEARARGECSRIERPRVDGRTGVTDHTTQRAPGDLPSRELAHRHAASSSAATTRSSNGVVTPPRVWPVS